MAGRRSRDEHQHRNTLFSGRVPITCPSGQLFLFLPGALLFLDQSPDAKNGVRLQSKVRCPPSECSSSIFRHGFTLAG